MVDKIDDGEWTRQLVTRLKQNNSIRTHAIERAFLSVERHLFVETFHLSGSDWSNQQTIEHDPENPKPEHLALIYDNRSLITHSKGNFGTSSASQPSVVAQTLELLELSPDMKVLEIGTGTGYNSALLTEIVGAQGLVVSIDIQSAVVADANRSLERAGYPNVKTIVGDGFEGAAKEAPFDRIVATVGCPDISPLWVEQLRPGGLMLVPLAHGGWHPLTRIETADGKLIGKVVGYSGFMGIQGRLESGSTPNGPLRLDIDSYGPHTAVSCPQSLRSLHDEELWYSFPPSLYYFLAAKDQRAFFCLDPQGYGLVDNGSGLLLVIPSRNQILSFGNTGLEDDFFRTYSEWERVGRPSPSDYLIEFTRLEEEFDSQESMSFVNQRQFFRQRITLRAQ